MPLLIQSTVGLLKPWSYLLLAWLVLGSHGSLAGSWTLTEVDSVRCCRQALGGEAQEFSVIQLGTCVSSGCFGGIQNTPTLGSSPVCTADRRACILESSPSCCPNGHSHENICLRGGLRECRRQCQGGDTNGSGPAGHGGQGSLPPASF